MILKDIKKKYRKINKALKGKTDFITLQKYIKDQYDYKVIFYNTDYGNRELVRYDLNDDALTTNAFTYSGNAKIIFINHNVSPEDKTYLLYHEIGHIVLGHFEDHKIALTSKYLLDIEADAFAYMLLCQRSRHSSGLNLKI